MPYSCAVCRVEFNVKPSRVKRDGPPKYCSRACQLKVQKTSVERECKQCLGKFLVQPSRLKREPNAGTYCSMHCLHAGRTKRRRDGDLYECIVCHGFLAADAFSESCRGGPDSRCKACKAAFRRKHSRTTRGRFVFAQEVARRRSHVWALAEAEYGELIAGGRCTYCDGTLDPTGIGLDRKDSSRGYTADNVTPCCGMCNRIKSDDFSSEEMLVLGRCIRGLLDERKGPQPGEKP